MLAGALRVLPLLLATALLGACAEAPDEEETASDAASAFTVANGARFVVSASPTSVVLARSVDGVRFPFDDTSLVGKALLIHPIAGRAETGVYARVRSVAATPTRYTVTSTPLSLDEMAALKEDEVVRIFIDPKSASRRSTTGATLSTASVDVLSPGLGLQAGADVNGFTFEGLDLQTGIDFAKPRFLRPGVTFANTVETASFTPDVLLDYTSAGLDVGFRGTFAWKSTLTIGGQLSGDFYRSPVLRTPPAAFFVPIGPFPVPVTVRGVAFAFCSVNVAGPANLKVNIAANAKVGGSLRFRASLDTPVSTGPWAPEASGSGSVGLTSGSSFSTGVSCNLPRVELHADVAGIVGPYLATSIIAGVDTASGASLTAQINAGFGSGLAEGVTSPEIGIYSARWPR